MCIGKHSASLCDRVSLSYLEHYNNYYNNYGVQLIMEGSFRSIHFIIGASPTLVEIVYVSMVRQSFRNVNKHKVKKYNQCAQDGRLLKLWRFRCCCLIMFELRPSILWLTSVRLNYGYTGWLTQCKSRCKCSNALSRHCQCLSWLMVMEQQNSTLQMHNYTLLLQYAL